MHVMVTHTASDYQDGGDPIEGELVSVPIHSPPDCFYPYCASVDLSIFAGKRKNSDAFASEFFLVTRTGIEPMLPP